MTGAWIMAFGAVRPHPVSGPGHLPLFRFLLSPAEASVVMPGLPQNRAMTARFVVLGLLLSGRVAAQSPPLPLPLAVAEAVSNNLDLAAQRLNIPVAEARAITARLRPNPVLTVSGQSLNLLGANFSPNTPLGPNQTNIHTDGSSSPHLVGSDCIHTGCLFFF